MIVEYLEDGAPECPLIRVFGTNLRDFVELREITRHLGDHADRSYDLATLGHYEFLTLDSLILINSGDEGVGIRDNIAYWRLAKPRWHIVSMLIDPFVQQSAEEETYQWLTGPESIESLNFEGISILLSYSRDGIW